jgi:hypothetical protein
MTVEITLTRGLPASGKSSWAEQTLKIHPNRADIVRIERDLLRDQLFGTRHGLSVNQEIMITQIQFAMAGAGFETVTFDDVSLDELIQRDMDRENSVGSDVIRMLWTKFTKNGKIPSVDVTKEMSESLIIRPYSNPSDLPEAIIVDIDGTMAKMSGRSPYEWMRVGEDEPVQAVIDAVKAAHKSGKRIIVMSGRDSSCKYVTLGWLKKHLGPDMSFKLFMRTEGDNRKDDLVKYELFNENVRDKYHVKYILDDRDQVIAMWRKLGIAAFQVEYGDF